ncbi:hypothetical protein POM88_029239 [Heracleum sosnowskyi]|uniref:Uncharacterized protein n=1 Tax=Heracleum sosnowskyi TaxID=360622 RepID=A0AAD8HUD1_9APIA|nr:hypothetical protein POM88_029239 [Heracleum sosnowskyi]
MVSWLAAVFEQYKREEVRMKVTICWSEWKARNELVWIQKGMEVSEVVVSTKLPLNRWNSAQDTSFDNYLGLMTQGEDGVEHWQAPNVDRIKVNVDSAIFEDSTCYSYTLVARDHNVNLIEALSRCVNGIVELEMAEMMGRAEYSNRNGENRDNGRGSSSCRVLRDISRNIHCGDGILPTPDIKTCKTPVGKVSSRLSPSSDFNKCLSDEGKSSNRNGKNQDNGRGSSSCRVLRDISRNIHCGDGILPTPDIKTCKTPVGKVSSRFSPSSDFNKSPSDEGKSSNRKSKGSSLKKGSSVPFNSPSSGFIKSPSDEGKSSNEKSNGSSLKKGSSVPFNIKVDCDKENYLYCKKLSYSERWAGPAYSNSPPPSSLPMPKFCVPSKVSVSLELACLESEIHLQPTSRSAPPSPKREHGDSTRNGFRSADDASVTKDLCRILNLDMTDE